MKRLRWEVSLEPGAHIYAIQVVCEIPINLVLPDPFERNLKILND